MDKKSNFIIKYLKYIGFSLDSEQFVNQQKLVFHDANISLDLITKFNSTTQNASSSSSIIGGQPQTSSLFGNMANNSMSSLIGNTSMRST